MSVLAGAMNHGGGFSGPDSPRGFRVWGQMLGL